MDLDWICSPLYELLEYKEVVVLKSSNVVISMPILSSDRCAFTLSRTLETIKIVHKEIATLTQKKGAMKHSRASIRPISIIG